MKIKMPDLSKEIDYLLLTTGLITFGVIILSFFDSASLSLSPVCISILESGTECSVCGMTRSFVAISNFDFLAAWNYNRAGIGIYSIFLIITMFATRRAYILHKNKNK